MSIDDRGLSAAWVQRRARGGHVWMRLLVRLGVAFADLAAVAVTAFVASLLTSRLTSGVWWYSASQVELAFVLAGLFVLLNAARGQYQMANYIAPSRDAGAALGLWGATFVVLIAFAFATKTTDVYSRAAVMTTFLAGLPVVLLTRHALGRALTIGAKIGVLPARRVMLVGREADVNSFAMRYQPWNAGMHIAGSGHLSDPGRLGDDLARIVAQARELRLDDVMIVVPWSETETIDRVIDAFMRAPVTIHLGPERIFDRFEHVRIAKAGGIASLQLGRPPLTAGEVIAKRAFDLAVASFGLFLLTPLFALVALAIALDSKGPIFFLQRRQGFNQRVFQIVKFRTMTTMDDGDVVRQATRNDQRITRVGRFLRRFNIDELPQLFNVIAGQMSLVGPRPHAIAHDRQFDDKIALYARRHNVKPGITGWAQVHGLRGETDTVDKMRRRVEHDLYYIDNWSLLLDVEIILRTAFSRRAYANAV